jgi:hypothetical protein
VKLEKNLENSKIFLNMVVHDLRNPTNQINFLIEHTLNILKDLFSGGYIFDKNELKNHQLSLQKVKEKLEQI